MATCSDPAVALAELKALFTKGKLVINGESIATFDQMVGIAGEALALAALKEDGGTTGYSGAKRIDLCPGCAKAKGPAMTPPKNFEVQWTTAKISEVVRYWAAEYQANIESMEWWIDAAKGEVVFRLMVSK